MDNKIVDLLNNLIVTAKDGEAGFKLAAEHATRPDLKKIFQDCSNERTIIVQKLQDHVRRLGGEAKDSSSFMGSVHRGWLNLRSLVAGDNDHVILAECEKGEDVAKAAFIDILFEELPQNVRVVLQELHDSVIKSHDLIRDLRDSDIE